jgi:hypothetical protein
VSPKAVPSVKARARVLDLARCASLEASVDQVGKVRGKRLHSAARQR